MDISRTERKVAASLRIQIRDGLVLVVQEGEGSDHIWLEFYGRYENPSRVESLAFTISRQDLAELCTVLQNFAAEITPEPAQELALA
jgi:hypothetical protein